MPLLLPLLSCASEDSTCPPGFLPSYGACVFDEDALLELVGTMDQGRLTRVNRETYYPVYGAPLARNVWVSPLPVPGATDDLDAAGLYASIDQEAWGQALPDEFPVGTVIIHECVDRSEAHGVEVKRDDYLDDAGRNWWLRKIFDDGTYEETVAEPCSNCHNDATRSTEGLWGIPAAGR